MQGIIDDFEQLRPVLEPLQATAEARPADSVRLCPPLPGRARSCAASAITGMHAQREPRALNMFMKNPEAVIGPGDTIRLAEADRAVDLYARGRIGARHQGPAKT
jgi:2-keto-4-pentenoate hydratase/2-oxohepta-3-ene-1,7-dioic acid hydratase in catechol pathway